ncbi:uncharacterized protein L3040_008435 [Drepanopeziza brunnea f. sp. 'multigermtubi']|uniref:uncharacterized protein n=1 Tax=Drepanopeziza brunnea f. sp. 'multigermtubi' TaxID=698441 RepID=UPI002392CAED|nr:hypothetical protein L3040_008435 [Drepanopeziza brunnea f. sp. 'multigermtubi']
MHFSTFILFAGVMKTSLGARQTTSSTTSNGPRILYAAWFLAQGPAEPGTANTRAALVLDLSSRHTAQGQRITSAAYQNPHRQQRDSQVWASQERYPRHAGVVLLRATKWSLSEDTKRPVDL